MLYKVTPMLPAPAAKPRRGSKTEGQAPRKKRGTAIYDGEGQEVLITLMCLKCKTVKPLAQFGLRKMADGAIRNQPWCRPCRSGAGTKPKKEEAAVVAQPSVPDPVLVALEAAPLPVAAEPVAEWVRTEPVEADVTVIEATIEVAAPLEPALDVEADIKTDVENVTPLEPAPFGLNS